MERRATRPRNVNAITFDITDSATTLPPRMLVDTNVWLLSQYSPFSLGNRQAAAALYTDFLGRCLDEGCELVRSPFTLPEVTHVIEKAESDAAKQRGNTMGLKQLRWEPNHRRKVIAEIVTTWQQVQGMSVWSPGLTVDGDVGDQMLADFRNRKIDGYDLLIVQEAMQGEGLPILTDDFDYLSVPMLRVYTANELAVSAARTGGKLRTSSANYGKVRQAN